MAITARLLSTLLATTLVLSACTSEETPTELATDETTTTVIEEVSSEPASVEPAEDTGEADEPTTEPTVPDEPEQEPVDDPVDEANLCIAPENELRFVDVPLDDPDGGLNLRSLPGADNEVLATFPRSSTLVTTGGCQTVGTFEWWEVVPGDGEETSDVGWVSSRFLSDIPVFNPGLGKAFPDTENVGIGGDTLDELAANLAEEYGFDDDVVITMVGEVVGQDAQGGSVVYDLTGLKDDASNGYRLEIDFIFDKNEDENAGEIEGYTAARITSYDLCSRGVTEDGLCL